MDFDYSDTWVLKVPMIKHLQKVLENFTEELRGTSSTPAVDHLFQLIGRAEGGGG